MQPVTAVARATKLAITQFRKARTKPCQSMAEVAAEIERLKCELDAAAEAARNHFGRN